MTISSRVPRIIFLILINLSVGSAWAATNNISDNQLPSCSTSWEIVGDIYTCTGDGRVSFTDGDDYIADNNSTIIANNGFSVSNNTIGTNSIRINLTTDYGEVDGTGDANIIWGNIDSNSGDIDLQETTVNGSIDVSQGAVSLLGGRVTGSVHSTCCGITAENTDLRGGASSQDGTVGITGGTLVGDFTSSGGDGVQIEDATIKSGSITTENVPIRIDNSSIGSSNNPVNLSTNNDSNLIDTIMTGDVDSGTFSASGITSVTGTCDPDPGGDVCDTDPPNMVCSNYHGQGTVNEMFQSGNTRFIEVKVLTTNVPQGQYRQWELTACRDNGFCIDSLPLSEAEDNYPWFTFSGDQLPGQGGNNIVQLSNPGMDVLLVDSSGDTIDYVRVSESGNYQSPGHCLPAYDWRIAPSNTSLVGRLPDGTGDWAISGPGGSEQDFSPTEGDGNDDVDTPDDQPAVDVDIRNVEIAKGETANFEIFLSETRDYEITVDYETADGPAIADEDYIPTQGTAVFSPNQSTVIVPVDTIANGPAELDEFFYLTISNADPGVIINHFATATFTEEAAQQLSHLEISHPETALTCRSVEVEFRACATEDCATLYDGAVDMTATSTGSGSWTDGANFSFTDETTRTFARTATGSTTLGVSDIDPSPNGDPPVRCKVGTEDSNCEITFVETALILTDSNRDPLSSDLLLDLVAGRTHNELYYLSAIETDDDTGACQAALSSESQTVVWSASTIDPDAPPPDGAANLLINGQAVLTTSNSSPDTELTVEFDANGRSVEAFDVSYADVGKLQLEASLDLDVENETRTLALIRNRDLLFRPAAFEFTDIACGSNNIGSGDDSGTAPAELDAFCRAGEEFTATVQVLNDVGDPTPNFGRESTDHPVDLTINLIAPTGVSAPAVDIVSPDPFTASDFSEGDVEVTLNWPEIGVIQLQASISSYLEWSSDEVDGQSDNIGRFVPAHFTLTSGNPRFLPEQLSGAGDFTYQGQPFGWDQHNTVVYFELTARNVNGEITENYTGDFNKFPDLSTHDPAANNLIDSLSKVNGPGGDLVETADSQAIIIDYVDDGAGVTLLTVSDQNQQEFEIQRNIYSSTNLPTNNDEPDTFSASLDLTALAFTDSDGTCVVNNDNDCTGGAVTVSGPELVYGRLRLFSVQGPEDRDLDMPMTLEYWTADGFQAFTREDDSDASLTTLEAGQFSASGLSGFDASTLGPNPGPFDYGEGIISLNSPGAPGRAHIVGQNEDGTVTIPEYLFFDWLNNGDNSPPRAIASFGTYEGRPPVLFMLPMGR